MKIKLGCEMESLRCLKEALDSMDYHVRLMGKDCGMETVACEILTAGDGLVVTVTLAPKTAKPVLAGNGQEAPVNVVAQEPPF